jgi:hypothetical protein
MPLHKRLLRCGLIATFILLLAGCAAPNIDDAHDVRGAKATGVVSGSITYAGPYGAYRLELVSKATGDVFRVEHGSSQSLNPMLAFKGEPPHAGLKRQGSPFAVALPVGSYEIRSWHISSGAANITSTAPTGVAFQVEAGQAIYLGNFHFRETSRIVRLISGAAVTMSDQAERDLAVIRSSFPALAAAPISQTINPAARVENFGGVAATRISIPIFIPVTR